jgi:hypothetical protein
MFDAMRCPLGPGAARWQSQLPVREFAEAIRKFHIECVSQSSIQRYFPEVQLNCLEKRLQTGRSLHSELALTAQISRRTTFLRALWAPGIKTGYISILFS